MAFTGHERPDLAADPRYEQAHRPQSIDRIYARGIAYV